MFCSTDYDLELKECLLEAEKKTKKDEIGVSPNDPPPAPSQLPNRLRRACMSAGVGRQSHSGGAGRQREGYFGPYSAGRGH